MTVETLAPEMTEAEARQASERIRSALDRVANAWAELADLITDAYQRRADKALGYSSWAEYAETELRPSGQIAAEVRRELVAMLSAQGMSTRAIAPTVGVSHPTVISDQRRQVVSDLPPEPEMIDVETGEVVESPYRRRDDEPLDDFRRRALHAATETGDILTLTGPNSVATPGPAKVVGLDGKSYSRPESTPRIETPRRPLRDGFRDAALDLDKLVRRFESLAKDDRLARNRSEVARYANDLTRAIDALQRVVSTLQ